MCIVIKIKLLRVKGQLSPNGGQAMAWLAWLAWPVATGLLDSNLPTKLGVVVNTWGRFDVWGGFNA